ncbi:MAG: DUF3857 domain-containing protein [Flavobacteriales bacterium]
MNSIKKMLSLGLIFCVFAPLQAQDYISSAKTISLKGIDVKEEYQVDTITQDVELFYRNVYDYDLNEEEETLLTYHLIHKVIYVHSDDAIEQHNKLYLPFSKESSSLVDLKAQVYTDGKIITLDENDILFAEDKEKGISYNYLAFEGIKKGSIIEYAYNFKTVPYFNGSEILLQTNTPKLDANFQVIYPNHIEFKTLSENGIPDVKIDTLDEDRNTFYLEHLKLSKLKEVFDGNYNKNRGKLKYKLHKNLFTGKSNLINYEGIAKNVFANLYGEDGFSKKEKSKVSKFLKQIDFKESDSALDKVLKIEHFIKTNIQVVENEEDSYFELTSILENKLASKYGLVKLFLAVLDVENIENEIVITCNRKKLFFDKDFFIKGYLSDYLLYFPEFDKYLEPENMMSRVGFIDNDFRGNNGYYIEKVDVGGMTTALGEIKPIGYSTHENTKDSMLINVTFDEETMNPIIEYKSYKSGYYALNNQSIFDFLEEAGPDAQKEYSDIILKSTDENMEIESSSFENKTMEYFPSQPFITNLKYTTESFTEQAGEKVLFKIGLIIGPQSELYNDEKRQMDVELDHQREYIRRIVLKIPEGYTLRNLDQLNINVFPKNIDKTDLGFETTYEIVGDELIINNLEYYRVNTVPVKFYEDYRSVINAAADFNKVVLILEPKE